MEENSRHKQHPSAHNNHTSSKPPTQRQRIPCAQDPVLHSISEPLSLDSSALNRPIVHDHTALVAYRDRARGAPSPVGQIRPADLLHQEVAPQHKQEHMATDVVAPAPLSSCSPARGIGEDILATRHALHDLGIRHLALAARVPEAPVDNRRAKTPLRDEHPPARHQTPAYQALRAFLRARRGGVREQKDKKGQRDPGPPLLDEEDVEDVALAGKVRRGKGRVLRMGLGAVVVGRVADGGREQREECAKGEDERVGDQKGSFDGRR